MAPTQETSASIIKSARAGRARYSQAYKDEVVLAYGLDIRTAARSLPEIQVLRC